MSSSWSCIWRNVSFFSRKFRSILSHEKWCFTIIIKFFFLLRFLFHLLVVLFTIHSIPFIFINNIFSRFHSIPFNSFFFCDLLSCFFWLLLFLLHHLNFLFDDFLSLSQCLSFHLLSFSFFNFSKFSLMHFILSFHFLLKLKHFSILLKLISLVLS